MYATCTATQAATHRTHGGQMATTTPPKGRIPVQSRSIAPADPPTSNSGNKPHPPIDHRARGPAREHAHRHTRRPPNARPLPIHCGSPRCKWIEALRQWTDRSHVCNGDNTTCASRHGWIGRANTEIARQPATGRSCMLRSLLAVPSVQLSWPPVPLRENRRRRAN
jgi:hypothetical protein